ncbi:hypothetical protein J3F84DRAFT_376383 [Trichoderma pleuroticola]
MGTAVALLICLFALVVSGVQRGGVPCTFLCSMIWRGVIRVFYGWEFLFLSSFFYFLLFSLYCNCPGCCLFVLSLRIGILLAWVFFSHGLGACVFPMMAFGLVHML